MKVDKVSVSLEAGLAAAVRAAAAQADMPLSTWLAEAAAAKLRGEALAVFLADWQAEHGALTPGEVSRAEGELAIGARDPRIAEAS